MEENIDYMKFNQISEEEKKINAEMQYRLGTKYYLGSGVDKDYNKALECYTNAAEQGYKPAQFNLNKIKLENKIKNF